MNIFARFINSFEKPPVQKTPAEKDQDHQEWKKHFGAQAEMAEEQEKVEEKNKQEQSKTKQEKEWQEHFSDQAKIAEEQEKAEQARGKQEKEWQEHFGPLTEIKLGQEKPSEAVKEAEKNKATDGPIKESPKERSSPEDLKELIKESEKATELLKQELAKLSKDEPLRKTELDSEYVLGKDRAKLAQELGERMRNKSAGAAEKPVNKESTRTVFETREGEKFFTERLIDPEDPRVNKVQEMLEKYFRSEEVDPVEVLKQAMTGKMATGEKVPLYLVHVAENAKGEIEGLQTGAVCETVDAKGNISKKSGISLGFYTVVSPEARQKGIFKNLFKAYEKVAVKYAKERGLKINGSMGEAHDEVESIFNNQGSKRAYIKAEGVFFELPYEQPPIDWNTETGKPTEGAGTMPEHLMLKLASGKNKVSGKEIMEMIRGMYVYNNYREEEYFKTKEAHKEHTEFVKKIEQNLADFIAGKTVYLLSAKEREAMKKKGVQFSEQEKVEK